MNMLRHDLEPLPDRMKTLPVDERGYVVPFFVEWIDGKPEFRAMDPHKWMRCVKERLCWVCGQRLGAYMSFVMGPMCGMTGTTSEPPCHQECARWSARNCPFLTRPHMTRRRNDLPEGTDLESSQAGCPILRNPGATLVWTTRTYRTFKAHGGNAGYLIRVGEASNVEWYAQGRMATRTEVTEAVDSGIPLLLETERTNEKLTDAEKQEAYTDILQRRGDFERLFPA